MTKEQWYVKVKFTEYVDFGDELYFDQSRSFDTLEEATDFYNKKYDVLFNFKGNAHFQIPVKEIIVEKPVKISVPLTETERMQKENAEYKEVLRIIFEKSVHIPQLLCAFENQLEVENPLEFYYNGQVGINVPMPLNQEEFELLKRWWHGNT